MIGGSTARTMHVEDGKRVHHRFEDTVAQAGDVVRVQVQPLQGVQIVQGAGLDRLHPVGERGFTAR